MNPRIILVIFGTFLVLMISLFTAHIYIYGLNTGNHASKSIWVAAFFIPILYIGSLIGTRNANKIGKTFYRIINIIAGIVFYLFLGALVLGIISIVYAIKNVLLPVSLPIAILSLSLLAALIAFAQAKYIRVKRYTVTLPGAPASWEGKTAAMISDTHFGLINHKKFADKVVHKILSLSPDFVLHAGDFYDGPMVDTVPITESWKKLTAQVPLFYTPGNHEAYGDYNVFIESVRAAGAVVLDDKVVDYDGVNIAGTLYHTGRESKDVGEVLKNLITTDASNTSGRFVKPTILINHPPTAFKAPHEHGVNLIVSGHTHQGQTWPFRYITHKVYGAYDYGMATYKSLTSITSNGIGTYGPPIRLFNSPEVVIIRFKTS
ncbi:MAG: metallophosphoesterase [Candidatus Paceibacterota bacterium]